jgi:hypothetical protein
VKKFIAGLIVGVGFMATTVIVADGPEQIAAFLRPDFKVTLEGQSASLDKPPVILNNTMYLPLKEVAELSGLNVTWNESTLTAELSKKPVEVKPMPTIQPLPSPTTPPRVVKTPMSKEAYLSSIEGFDGTIKVLENQVTEADRLLQKAIKDNSPEFIKVYTKSLENMSMLLERTKQDRLDIIALYPEYQ